MFQRLEIVRWLAGDMFRRVSNSTLGQTGARRLAHKFEEFVRRVRRAGLLFFVTVAALLALSLVHPIGFLLWLILLPLIGFASVLSMLWPTRRFLIRQSAAPRVAEVIKATLSRLLRLRGEIPLVSRTAFDSVVRQLKSMEVLVSDSHNTLIVDEARRLIGQHLPRLVNSFVALVAGERTDVRINALTDGLGAIAEELTDLCEQLSASRTDRFEIERQFIATRFPRRNGLASV